MTQLQVGLNAYGIAYTVGLTGAGTPRANPRPLGMDGFIDLAVEIGASVISLPTMWLDPLTKTQRQELARRVASLDLDLIIDGAVMQSCAESLAICEDMRATLMRSTLSSVLEGGRAAQGATWRELVDRIPGALSDAARQASQAGVTIALENHQDFTSGELAAFCREAGESIGVCFDVGNALSVGEDPVDFARTVAPHLALLHLKDYYVQWTEEGYRLVRCAIGAGAVQFKDVVEALGKSGCRSDVLPALIEPGALDHRHIRLLCRDWWEGYPPREASDLAAGIAAARRGVMSENEDWRTPWEADAVGDPIIDYEMRQLHDSLSNLKQLGLMP